MKLYLALLFIALCIIILQHQIEQFLKSEEEKDFFLSENPIQYSILLRELFNRKIFAKRLLTYDKRKQGIRKYCLENQDDPEQRYLRTKIGILPMYFRANRSDIFVHYCGMGKVGGRTWRQNIAEIYSEQLLEDKNYDEGHILKLYKKHIEETLLLKTEEAKSLTSLSFVFVRNPLSRLVSAYYDKMFRNWSGKRTPVRELGPWPIRRRILMQFRNWTEEEAERHTDAVTEAEFARFVIESYEKSVAEHDFRRMDPHWRPQTTLCDFCQMDFDVVGKIETFEEDKNFIYRALGKEVNKYWVHICIIQGE